MEPYDVVLPESFRVAYRTPAFRTYHRLNVLWTAGPVSVKQKNIDSPMMKQRT